MRSRHGSLNYAVALPLSYKR